MAPLADSSYFPPLDKCLAGEVRLISWRTAYQSLCEEEEAVEKTNLERFFRDSETIKNLSSVLDPLSRQCPRSAEGFDTKTAPINVSQNENRDYDLNEIKDDAKWLSKELGIEEVAALRVAIIEWQERPADQLLQTTSSNAVALSNTKPLPELILSRSALGLTAPDAGSGVRQALDFAKSEIRRGRLVDIFLSERDFILKISASLVTRYLASKPSIQSHPTGALRENARKSWISEVASHVTGKLCESEKGTDNIFTTKCIKRFDSILARIDDQRSWPNCFQNDEAKAQAFIDSQFSELISVLRLLLAALYALDGISSPTTIKAWFEAMEKCHFGHGDRPCCGQIEVFQLLTSIISVEILKAQLVVEELMKDDAVRPPNPKEVSWIKDEECITFLNGVFRNSALAGLATTGPAMFAWSIITSLVRDVSELHKEARLLATEQTNSITGRDVRSEYEKIYDSIVIQEWTSQTMDTPKMFAVYAVDRMEAFGTITSLSYVANMSFSSQMEIDCGSMCKETLLNLVREGMPFIEYGDTLLNAVLSIITPSDTSSSSCEQASVLSAKLLFDYTHLRPGIVEQALARYPYELSPLLRLFTALSSAEGKNNKKSEVPQIVRLLDNIHTYTQCVDMTFDSYELDHEDTDSNSVLLKANLPIFAPRQSFRSWSSNADRLAVPLASQQQNASPVLAVPVGAGGNIVKESRPFVFKMNHPHSGLEYLGLLLSTFPATSELVPATPSASLDKLLAAEVVILFNALLSAMLKQAQGIDNAVWLLGRLSHALPDDQDITLVIANIFEAELLAHLDQVAQNGSLELVTACAEFLNIVVKISPESVWSILIRSSLLGLAAGAASLAAVVRGVEFQTGQYRFFRACVELHSLLLEDAICGLVKRKAQGPKTTHRYAEPVGSRDITPERTISTVLYAYQKILQDAFHNMQDWNFEVPREKCIIITSILQNFAKLLECTYGVGIAAHSSNCLTITFAPAASLLFQTYVSEGGINSMIETLQRVLSDGFAVAEDSAPTQIRILLVKQVRSCLRFLTILLKVARADLHDVASVNGVETAEDEIALSKRREAAAEERRRFCHERTLALASDLLKTVPALASLLASEHAFKSDLFSFLGELITAAGSGDGDPPPMLSALEPVAQKSFLQVINQLDRPLCDVQVERRIWDFLSAVMNSKQPWFSAYLLTGSLPKKRTKDSKSASVKGESILRYVLEKLSSITILPPESAIGMLKFLSCAQRTWIWTSTELRTHPSFIKNTLAWVDTLGPGSENPSQASSIIRAKELEMASYFCDIVAVSLRANQETGDKTLLKQLLPKLNFLIENGVKVNAYNRSLHRNLADNLKRRFSEVDLSNFRRTEVNPAAIGTEFYYDRDLAEKVLHHDTSWYGTNKGRNQGFSEEFAIANANLSLVYAQGALLKHWGTLVTALCDFGDEDSDVQNKLVAVVKSCLSANTVTELDEPGAADLLDSRIQLAFVAMSRLASLKVESQDIKGVLGVAWELVQACPVDYEIATALDDIKYYRSLLRVLYLSIQPHSSAARPGHMGNSSGDQSLLLDASTASHFVGIVGRVIIPGFRALCGNLHNNRAYALPADFALLTALLQAVFSTPGISSVSSLLSDIVAGSSIIRGALSLYSWSDQLAEATGQDPIYGEVAVMFLLALSTVRSIAEQIALQGALTHLSSGNLSNYFRKPGGKGPFDEPQRMYAIWTDGFLPLVLNLLDSAGPSFAGETAVFLNSFPEQLHRAERSLQNEAPTARNPRAGAVTLSLITEAHSLSMISLILSSDAARAATQGMTVADIPDLEYDVDVVKTLIEALSRSKRSLRDRITPTTPLEDRWTMTPVSGSSDNLLQQKVMREIGIMNECLGSTGDS